MRRELGRKPLNSLIDFEPVVALGGLDEQNSLYFPGIWAFSETSSQLTPPSSGESVANLTFGARSSPSRHSFSRLNKPVS